MKEPMKLTKRLDIDSLLVNTESILDKSGSILALDKEGGYLELAHPVLSMEVLSNMFGESPIPRNLDPNHYPDRSKIEFIKVPYIPTLVIDDNTCVIEEPYLLLNELIESPKDRIQLQRDVIAFETSLVSKMAGKSGLLQRWVYGTRCSNSIRAVAAPSIEITVNQVGVPEYACRKAKIKENDWVLLTRSPVLHEGSVLLLQVVMMDGLAIRIHPLHNTGLGCDFDGDEIEVKKVDPSDYEIEEQLGACLSWAKWPVELNMQGSTLEERVRPLESTLGPEDMLDTSSSILGLLEKAGGKVPKDLDTYIKGCNEDTFAKVAYETTIDLAYMKVNIGKVGAITDVIASVLSKNKETINLALQFKEHITQTLLDSKHGADVMFDPDKLVAMFNRQGKYKELDNELIAEEAVLMGIDKELVLRVLNLLSSEGIYNQIRELPEIALARGLSSTSSIYSIYNGNSSKFGIAAMIKEIQNVFNQPQTFVPPREEHREDQLQDMPF